MFAMYSFHNISFYLLRLKQIINQQVRPWYYIPNCKVHRQVSWQAVCTFKLNVCHCFYSRNSNSHRAVNDRSSQNQGLAPQLHVYYFYSKLIPFRITKDSSIWYSGVYLDNLCELTQSGLTSVGYEGPDWGYRPTIEYRYRELYSLFRKLSNPPTLDWKAHITVSLNGIVWW